MSTRPLSPAEYARQIAETFEPLTEAQVEAAARILASAPDSQDVAA